LQITDDERRSALPCDYSYSLGFYLNLGHPEILIMGLPSTSGAMINDLFAYVESGKRIEENQTVRYDCGLGEKTLIAKAVPEDLYSDYMGYGCWFYRSSLRGTPLTVQHHFPVMQLVWPDPHGKYPWEPGCDHRSLEIQTLIPQDDPT
jgi:hypothetical protein